MKIRKLCFVVINIGLLALISACFQDSWRAIIYPNKNDLTKDIRLAEFKSLEECRSAASSYISANNFTNADYECGLNCEFNKDMDLYICKETLR